MFDPVGLSAHSYPNEHNDKDEDKADHKISNQKLASECPPHHDYKSVDGNNLGSHN